MKRGLILSFAVLLLAGALTQFANSRRVTDPAPVMTAAHAAHRIVAAPGRIEPVSEEITIGAELGGKLKETLASEGDHIRAGAPLAVLENRDLQAATESAQARLRESQATLLRLINGARLQERMAALAEVQEAAAVLENARVEELRRQGLLQKGAISREEAERATRSYDVARARYEAARQRYSLVDAAPREEDRARAEAAVALARSEVEQSEAMLAKSFIRSPINGVVLRKYRNAGENVDRTTPIFAVGDVSRLRVRADIDENDVAALKVGQKAYVTAAAYGSRKFTGYVSQIGQALGKKNIRTDEPSERVDTKILETLIDLDRGERLPPNLRVDVFIHAKGASDGAK